MLYTTTMQSSFENEKNRKAFLYTAIIVAVLLLVAILWKWTITPPPQPVAQDLIEINLGNLDEGFGDVQPLIKGDKAPGNEPAQQEPQPPAPASNTPEKDEVAPEDDKDEDAAPVVKPEKKTPTPVKSITPAPQPVKNPTPAPPAPETKPRQPKVPGYNGPRNGTGNGATEDNGYKYEGNKPGGRGDAGDPNGKPDSYGNNPGGRSGGGNSGPRIISGDRKIVRYYSFSGEYEKATIYAVIKVSPEGRGTFTGFAKNSTSRSTVYSNAISQYLSNMQFDKSDHESTVTVQFNFNIKQ
jgi:hypothetical protein